MAAGSRDKGKGVSRRAHTLRHDGTSYRLENRLAKVKGVWILIEGARAVHGATNSIALAAALPIAKNPGAIDLLVGLGFGRNAARRLIADRTGRNWILAGPGTKRDSYILQPLAGNDALEIPSLPVVSYDSIPAGPVPQARQETPLKNDSAPGASETPDSCRSFSVDDRDDEVREVEVEIE